MAGQGPTLTSIAVTPVNPSIPVNGTQQFTATGTFSVGPPQDLTASVTWTAPDLSGMNVASISNTGLATGISPGTSTITATSGAISGTTTLTVTTPPPPPPPGVLARVSISSDGPQGSVQGNGSSPASLFDARSMALSRNGRYAVFTSGATNLDPAAPNTAPGVFLRDTCRGGTLPNCTKTTTRIPVPLVPEPGISGVDITPDGAWIAFTTALNTGTEGGVWVRSRTGGAPPVRLNDLNTLSTKGFDKSWTSPALSDNGRFVGVQTNAALLAADTNGQDDIYLFDRDADGNGVFDETAPGAVSVAWVSVTPTNGPGNGASANPDISADGRYVVFMSSSTDLFPGTTLNQEILMRDTLTSTTLRVSADTLPQGAVQTTGEPRMSADARYVVFDAILFSGRTQIYRADTVCMSSPPCAQPYTLISVATDGVTPASRGVGFPSISADGRFVGFESDSTDLTNQSATPFAIHSFVRDMCTGAPAGCTPQTNRVSQLSDGTEGNCCNTTIIVSPDGAFAVFTSSADNLDPPDTNFQTDIFIAATGFTPTVILPNPLPPPLESSRAATRTRVRPGAQYAVIRGEGRSGGRKRAARMRLPAAERTRLRAHHSPVLLRAHGSFSL